MKDFFLSPETEKSAQAGASVRLAGSHRFPLHAYRHFFCITTLFYQGNTKITSYRGAKRLMYDLFEIMAKLISSSPWIFSPQVTR
jgi:hypothetical protein